MIIMPQSQAYRHFSSDKIWYNVSVNTQCKGNLVTFEISTQTGGDGKSAIARCCFIGTQIRIIAFLTDHPPPKMRPSLGRIFSFSLISVMCPDLGHIFLLIRAKFDEVMLFIYLFEKVWRKSNYFPFLIVI